MRRTEGAKALQKLQTPDEKEEREGARAESPLQKLETLDERKSIGARAEGSLENPELLERDKRVK